MIDLPPARRIRAVCIAREGGFAWTPGLSRPRSVGLDGDGGATRQRLMQMLREAAERGCESGPGVQGADRRRYRVEIFIDEDDNDGDDVGAGGRGDGPVPAVVFEVPEEQAPESLVRIWKEAG